MVLTDGFGLFSIHSMLGMLVHIVFLFRVVVCRNFHLKSNDLFNFLFELDPDIDLNGFNLRSTRQVL